MPKVALRKQPVEKVVVEKVEDEPMELEEGVDALLSGETASTTTPPTGVRDIDAEDLWNPQLCGEYAKVQ